MIEFRDGEDEGHERGGGSAVPTAFERAGGEAVLRPAIEDFVRRVYADAMIGFFFRHYDAKRLVRLEYQHLARALGAEVAYEGRPLRRAHAKHRIMGGQFARRKQILLDVLTDHGLPDDIIEAVMRHTEGLRAAITAQPGSTCVDETAGGPLVSSWRPGDDHEADGAARG